MLTHLSEQDAKALQANTWRAKQLLSVIGPGSKVARSLVEDILAANAEVLDTSSPSHVDTSDPAGCGTDPLPTVEAVTAASPKLRVGLFVGHTKGTGAQAIDGSDEWETRNEVALAAADILAAKGFDAHVIYRDGRLSYADAMRAHGEVCKSKKLDVSLELHFNAYDGEAHGAEIVVASQKTAQTLGNAFQEATKAFYPDRALRGVKLKTGGRGYLFNANQKCPSGIYEPFFGDSPEWYDYAEDVEKEAAYVADIIERFHTCPG